VTEAWPVIGGLDSRPKRYAVLTFLTLGSAYFGGYLLLVWPWSP